MRLAFQLLRTHVVDLDPSNDEAPLGVTNAPFTFAASAHASTSSITATIVALSSQMTAIHTDLVERIGLVNERVNLIVERQAHDIVSIRDTLSALSRRHTEFIIDVNDFIRSIRGR
ncbi:hypothetical protein Acr_23g0011350 [Actinidia rufa]|uniref:Uncharacterized protein n=1 Tax=Actinidia rufa TaxID=165716 RepID=A0A7J0GPK7_9ERIC|nr:hypothetical protein Acr_23g0011350 [Actinidia rufa]